MKLVFTTPTARLRGALNKALTNAGIEANECDTMAHVQAWDSIMDPEVTGGVMFQAYEDDLETPIWPLPVEWSKAFPLLNERYGLPTNNQAPVSEEPPADEPVAEAGDEDGNADG